MAYYFKITSLQLQKTTKQQSVITLLKTGQFFMDLLVDDFGHS